MRDETAEEILDLALSREPTLGYGRLIAIDGPSGAGKTTLAASIHAEATARGLAPTTLSLDLLYAGWSGLPGIGGTLDALLRPLSLGREGEAATWDWEADGPGPDLVLAPLDLLILEGVGAGHRRIADLLTVLVHVTGDAEDAAGRLDRALRRDEGQHEAAAADPAAYAGRLAQWQRAETEHFAVDDAEGRADIVLG